MALTGNETLLVLGQNPTGRPAAVEQQTTTGAIAALAEAFDTTDLTLTALTTVGAGTITAAGIVGGATLRGGAQSASPFTDTTATAALIIAALPSWAQVGQAFYYTYINNTDAIATIAGGSGVTVSGITTVQPNMAARFLVTYATSSTVTVAGVDTAIYNPANPAQLGGGEVVNGGAVFNENSADVDFRVESNGNANALFVDGGNDRVGILNASPAVALDVTGAITASTTVTGAALALTTVATYRVATILLTAAELGGVETNTSFSFPANGAILLNAWLNITDGETGTVDVGTQGTSNDPNGIMEAAVTTNTGYAPTVAGALLGKFITGGDPVSVTSSGDLNSCTATLYIYYIELPAPA